ncbi:MAG: hypothetical protein HOH88_02200 [Flavobacteriales bacterium]|jgi:hypothetical protein|nr:hypothetical protein [Flavobacteriales bacterium]
MKGKYILFFCTLISFSVFSQKVVKEKSPKKAAIYSAILPGSGQVYTKKYWKVPIIYGGLITSGYFIKNNNDRYIMYKEATLNSLNDNTSSQIVEGVTIEYDNLKIIKDHYRRNREISILCFVGTYILNIVDASVNAHLFHFDVSDDISLNIQPYSTLSNTGLIVSFNF